MPGSPINYPHAFADSGTASGAQVQAMFDAINTHASTTKWSTAELQKPRADVPIFSIALQGNVAVGTYRFYRKVPAGVTYRCVSGQIAANDVTTSGATVTFDVQIAGTSIFTTAPNTAANDTVDERTGFTSSPYDVVPGTTIQAILTVATGGAIDVSACLWGSTGHRS